MLNIADAASTMNAYFINKMGIVICSTPHTNLHQIQRFLVVSGSRVVGLWAEADHPILRELSLLNRGKARLAWVPSPSAK